MKSTISEAKTTRERLQNVTVFLGNELYEVFPIHCQFRSRLESYVNTACLFVGVKVIVATGGA